MSKDRSAEREAHQQHRGEAASGNIFYNAVYCQVACKLKNANIVNLTSLFA
jgi:hypothetical protein